MYSSARASSLEAVARGSLPSAADHDARDQAISDMEVALLSGSVYWEDYGLSEPTLQAFGSTAAQTWTPDSDMDVGITIHQDGFPAVSRGPLLSPR
jgi:DNA polymerase sigma